MTDTEDRWAASDRRRAETEAFYAEKRKQEREKYVGLIEAELRRIDPGGMLSPYGHAEIAYDTLAANGVVFARFITQEGARGEV